MPLLKSPYPEILADFLGLPSVDIDENPQSHDLTLKLSSPVEQWTQGSVGLESMWNATLNALQAFRKEYPTADELAINQLLPAFLAVKLIGRKATDTHEFLRELQSVSIRTYESRDATMGFVIAAGEPSTALNELGLDFTPLSSRELKTLLDDKENLVLIDSQSIALVLDLSYQCIGIAQKRRDGKSVHDTMLNRFKSWQTAGLSQMGFGRIVEFEVSTMRERIGKQTTSIARQRDEVQRVLKYSSTILGVDISTGEELATYLQEHKDTLTEDQRNDITKGIAVIKDNATALINDLLDKSSIEKNQKTLDKRPPLVDEVRDTMMNAFRAIKPLQYVYIREGRIHVVLVGASELVVHNGRWRIRNFDLLLHILAGFVFAQLQSTLKLESFDEISERSSQIGALFDFIKSLVDHHIGTVIVVTRADIALNGTIYKKLLQHERLSKRALGPVSKTSQGRHLTVGDIDPYLLRLFASVDGAIILDAKVNLISFGEMIKTPSVKDGTLRGAGTHAAKAASEVGLGIKVSEDGVITVFHRQLMVASIH